MSERQLELAEAHESRITEDRIARARALVPAADRVGPEHCRSCGDEIPLVRREMGHDECVSCVDQRERLKGVPRR